MLINLISRPQAAVNAFMHQAQASSTTSVSASEANCGLDVKPSLSNGNGGGGQSVPKQREGTSSLNVTSNNNGSGQNAASNAAASQGANGSASLNGGLFDVPQNPYNGYENGYGGGGGGGSGAGYGAHPSQANAYQSSTGTKMAMNSPHSKSQRTKSRTNAGKTFPRHGVGYFKFMI